MVPWLSMSQSGVGPRLPVEGFLVGVRHRGTEGRPVVVSGKRTVDYFRRCFRPRIFRAAMSAYIMVISLV
jgi:hypothetical protein